MLEIKGLEAGYGKKQVLYELWLEVPEKEVVALIGPNGAGKSTVLKAVCGLIPVWKGEIRFKHQVISGSSVAQNLSHGIVYLPQGNRVFDDLTVMENLEIGGFRLHSKDLKGHMGKILGVFPGLKSRLHQYAGTLSGGEQQMLALARALMTYPKMLMLDEPSLGLSPGLVNTVFEKISEINRETGTVILIVEQKVNEVLEVCHRVYSLKLGRVTFSGRPEELKGNKDKLRELFL